MGMGPSANPARQPSRTGSLCVSPNPVGSSGMLNRWASHSRIQTWISPVMAESNQPVYLPNKLAQRSRRLTQSHVFIHAMVHGQT